MSRKRDISAALLGIYVAMILWITVLGREPQLGGRSFYPLFHTIATIRRDIRHIGIRGNFLGNIVLFIPIGIALPVIFDKQKWFWTVGAGCSFSCVIEIIQLVSSRGCFDPDDLLLNTLGTVIGSGLFHIILARIGDVK